MYDIAVVYTQVYGEDTIYASDLSFYCARTNTHVKMHINIQMSRIWAIITKIFMETPNSK